MRDLHHVFALVTLPSSGIEIEVKVGFTYRPGCPAQTYGEADRCYPAEASEVELYTVVGLETGLDVLEICEREHEPFRPFHYQPWPTRPLIEGLAERVLETFESECAR